MNCNSSKLNESKTEIKEQPIKKYNQPLSYLVHKNKFEIIIQKGLKTIISNLKNEIIHIFLDKTGKNPNKISKQFNDNENDNSFNGKRLLSTYNNKMTDIKYTISPLRRESNDNDSNKLWFQYSKSKDDCELLRKSSDTKATYTQQNLSFQFKPRINKKNENASIIVTESNAKRIIKQSISNKTENNERLFQNKQDNKKTSKE